MKVLLILAMESELNGFLSKLDYDVLVVDGIKTYHAKVNNVDLYMAKSNVGKVFSACLTTTLCIKLMPNYVINAGIAGGLNPNLKIGDIVYSSKVAYHDLDLTPFGLLKGEFDKDFRYFEGSKKLLSLVGENSNVGLIVSGDQFIGSKDKLDVIKKDFPKSLACDMEGCSISHAAYLQDREFLVIRAISDNVFMAKDEASYKDLYFDGKAIAIEAVANATLSLLNKL